MEPRQCSDVKLVLLSAQELMKGRPQTLQERLASLERGSAGAANAAEPAAGPSAAEVQAAVAAAPKILQQPLAKGIRLPSEVCLAVSRGAACATVTCHQVVCPS